MTRLHLLGVPSTTRGHLETTRLTRKERPREDNVIFSPLRPISRTRKAITRGGLFPTEMMGIDQHRSASGPKTAPRPAAPSGGGWCDGRICFREAARLSPAGVRGGGESRRCSDREAPPGDESCRRSPTKTQSDGSEPRAAGPALTSRPAATLTRTGLLIGRNCALSRGRSTGPSGGRLGDRRIRP